MISKFKHKSLHEIAYRTRELLADKIRAYRFKPETAEKLKASVRTPSDKSVFLNGAARPRFFFNSDRNPAAAYFKNNYPQQYNTSIKRADEMMTLRFKMLGREIKYENTIDWNADPVTGYLFPLKYFRQVDIFSDDQERDIKYIWEVNRHQFFIDLGKAYFISGDEKYVSKIITLFNDWIEACPYKLGVNWSSALEVAVRAYAWIWTLYFILDSDQVDTFFLKKFVQNIYLHGKYLNENLSLYFSPYNHLIGETSALFLIGYLFPEFKESKKWRRKTWKILQSQLSKQFHRDGMTVEQASFYHYFTLGFYLQPFILKKQNGDKIPAGMEKHLREIMQFSMHLTRPDGRTPAIGDIDNARSIYFNDPENWDFKNFLAIGSLLFNDRELKYVAGEMPEDLLWLFGSSGCETYRQLTAIRPKALVRHFPESGYLIGRGGWRKDSHYFTFDCGPLAAGVFKDEVTSAAHGHADLLNFEIAAYGKPLIVDAGFHNYRGNFDWHSYFRLTRAHNCLVIDRQPQARHGGILVWSHAPEPQFIKYIRRDALIYFCGSHDAYDTLPGKPKHLRHFFYLNDDIWIIADRVSGSGNHLIESYLHFAPLTFREEKNTLIASTDDVKLNILFLGESMELEFKQGGNAADEGWLAPLYREKVAAPHLRRFRETAIPFSQIMILIPQKQDRVDVLEKSDDYCSFQKNDKNYQIRLNHKSDGGHIFMQCSWDNRMIRLNHEKHNLIKLQSYKNIRKDNPELNWEEQFEINK